MSLRAAAADGRSPATARYFATPAAWRAWLARHHARASELWVGFHRKATGRPSITWPQSVDQALCFGWIDGLRKGVDAGRYAIRFTPRRPASIWSRVNTRRFAALDAAGLARAAGRRAYAARREERSGVYSFERRPRAFPPALASEFRAHADAWAYFRSRPPGYRRTVTAWVTSAKRDETRRRRLAQVIADCAAHRTLAILARAPGRR